MGGCPSPWACGAYPRAGHGYDSTNLPYSLMCHRSQKKKMQQQQSIMNPY